VLAHNLFTSIESVCAIPAELGAGFVAGEQSLANMPQSNGGNCKVTKQTFLPNEPTFSLEDLLSLESLRAILPVVSETLPYKVRV